MSVGQMAQYKMSLLKKLAYRFDAIPINIPVGLVLEIDK